MISRLENNRHPKMALVNCAECGKDVSTEAISCPHCGYDIKNIELQNSNGTLVRLIIDGYWALLWCGFVLGFLTTDMKFFKFNLQISEAVIYPWVVLPWFIGMVMRPWLRGFGYSLLILIGVFYYAGAEYVNFGVR